MYSLTNLMAAIFIFSMIPEDSASTSQEAATEQNEPQESGYVVIESIENDIATIETEKGTFHVPRKYLPSNINREGMVIEWHISESEHDRRMDEAKARIDRLQKMSQK